MASEYRHRCNLCYVCWLCVTGGSKLTRANKEYYCEDCERLIQKGEHYNLAFRKVFLHARYPKRVHICTDCVRQVPATDPATTVPPQIGSLPARRLPTTEPTLNT